MNEWKTERRKEGINENCEKKNKVFALPDPSGSSAVHVSETNFWDSTLTIVLPILMSEVARRVCIILLCIWPWTSFYFQDLTLIPQHFIFDQRNREQERPGTHTQGTMRVGTLGLFPQNGSDGFCGKDSSSSLREIIKYFNLSRDCGFSRNWQKAKEKSF